MSEIPRSKLQCPRNDQVPNTNPQMRGLCALDFGIWSLGLHWTLGFEIGHYFSSTLQYASLRNRDQLSMRTSGEA